jgi:hypothetical protein
MVKMKLIGSPVTHQSPPFCSPRCEMEVPFKVLGWVPTSEK